MAILVSILGGLATLIGLVGLVKPQFLGQLVDHWKGAKRFWLAVVVRFVLGVLLLLVAPDCRLPLVVQIVGGISIAAAVVILLLGQSRLDTFIAWWLQRLNLMRPAAIFVVAFGVLLLYAGA